MATLSISTLLDFYNQVIRSQPNQTNKTTRHLGWNHHPRGSVALIQSQDFTQNLPAPTYHTIEDSCRCLTWRLIVERKLSRTGWARHFLCDSWCMRYGPLWKLGGRYRSQWSEPGRYVRFWLRTLSKSFKSFLKVLCACAGLMMKPNFEGSLLLWDSKLSSTNLMSNWGRNLHPVFC